MSDTSPTPTLGPPVRIIGTCVAPPAGDPTSRAPLADAAAGTSRRLWVVYGLVVALLLVLRLPQALDQASASLQGQAPAEIDDPAMLALAVKVGGLLGTLMYLVAAAVNGLIAGVAERRLRLPTLGVGHRRVGLLYSVLVAAVVPVQLAALALGHAPDKTSIGYVAYIVAVALVVPAVMHRVAGRGTAAGIGRSAGCAAALLLLVCAF